VAGAIAPGPAPARAATDWRDRLRGRGAAAFVAAIITLAMLLAPERGPLPWLRSLGFDLQQRVLPRVRKAQPAVIVAIDEGSLEAIGQWPWPRDTLATLVDAIAARKPAAIGMDILFNEPDRTSPELLAARFDAVDADLAARLRRRPAHDTQFAAALARAPVVLGIVGTPALPGRQAGTPEPGPGFAPARLRGDMAGLQAFAHGARSLPVIDAAARGRGLLNATMEVGVVRRVPLVALVGGQPLLSLPLECLRVAAGEPVFGVYADGPGSLRVVIGDLAVPGQDDGSLYVHYSGHAASRYVSALDVLRGREAPGVLDGRVVLLGVTAQGLVDEQLLPSGDVVPGVEIHAEVLENVYEGALLRRPASAPALETLAFALLSALAIVLVPRLSPRVATLAFLAGALALCVASLCAYRAGLLFDALSPLAAFALVQSVLVLATMRRLDSARRALALEVAQQREAAARTAGEMAAAMRVQTGMLPRAARVLGDDRRVALFAHMRPARDVGGDLYDFFYLNRRRLFAAVGDVAGKGVGAALFMAVSKALTKSAGLRGIVDLGELLEAINIELSRDNPQDLFVTLLVVVLDLDTGRLDYCNAGHEPLLVLRRDGRVEAHEEGGGPPLCVVDYARYASASLVLAPGDGLALVSDGLTEASSPGGELFGRERLQALLAGEWQGPETTPVDAVGAGVLHGVAAFEAGNDPDDDQTLLLLRWCGPATENAN
jgi:serine phosphatase RsbU (regulator of sigma subunit)/CHASE2 domain-containing sensor protein